jgi:hypothetical protein
MPAACWRDGQFAHDVQARMARRALSVDIRNKVHAEQAVAIEYRVDAAFGRDLPLRFAAQRRSAPKPRYLGSIKVYCDW